MPKLYLALPVLAALACASCSSTAPPSAATGKSGSPATKRGMNSPESLGSQSTFAKGYPRPEVGPDGLATGQLLVLIESKFPANLKASEFRITTRPEAGGVQTESVALDELGGLVGRLDPADKSKVVPAAIVVPAGRQVLDPVFKLQITEADGTAYTETYIMSHPTVVMPAKGDKVPATPATTPATKK